MLQLSSLKKLLGDGLEREVRSLEVARDCEDEEENWEEYCRELEGKSYFEHRRALAELERESRREAFADVWEERIVALMTISKKDRLKHYLRGISETGHRAGRDNSRGQSRDLRQKWRREVDKL